MVSTYLLDGINKEFGLDSDPEILINGSSMIIAGFDKSVIENRTNKKTAFYSRQGVSLADRAVMMEHFFGIFPDDVQTVIFEVNPLIFSNRFSAENVYTLFYPYMDSPAIDTFIRSKAEIREYYIHKYIRSLRYDINLVKSSINGHLRTIPNVKTQILDTNSLEGLRASWNSVEVEINPDKIELFEGTIKSIQEHGASVILINMPMYSLKFKTFRTSDYQDYISYLETFSRKHQNVIFLDLNINSINSHNRYFSDPLHLNHEGEQIITDKLIDILTN
jgi:hypothetical protein